MRRGRVLHLVLVLLLLSACGRRLPEDTEEFATLGPDINATEVEVSPTPMTDVTEVVLPAPEEEDIIAEPEAVPEVAQAPDDPFAQQVVNANPSNGETLYNQSNSTGFACSNCHSPVTEDRLVGPGLWHIPNRAVERVEGQGAVEYLYTSIVNPNAYIVDTYPENLMPLTYSEIWTDDQIWDVVAYLMTLTDEPVPVEVAAAPTVPADEGEVVEVTEGVEVAEVTAEVEAAELTEAAAEETESAEVAEATEAIVEEDTDVIEVTEAAVEATEAAEVVEATEAPTPAPAPTEVAMIPASVSIEDGIPEFGQFVYNRPAGENPSCAECHSVDGSDSSSVTMLNVVARRPSNVAPEDYLYNSIVNPSVHEDLPDAYTEVLDGALIEDLVAYLMTLQDAEALDTALGEPAQTSDAGGDTGALAEQIQAADASLGETLFTTTNDTGFACSTCHLVDSTEQLVGPGLLGIPSHADDRVEGQNRYEYLYNSIIHPNEYVVEGFNEGLMPQGYDELYANEQEVYALVAYLLTLEEE